MIELFILAISSVALWGYLYVQHSFGYWKRLGVPHVAPTFPFGNRTKATIQVSLLIRDFYSKLKDSGSPLFGMYFFQQPIAVVRSLELAKSVLIKDFQYFIDRGVYSNETSDPLSAHLFAVRGEKWRKVRHELTPTFTSGKMKFMYPTMVEVGERFEKSLGRMVNKDELQVEVKDLLARFTTDVIGSCAFGIECNSLENPNAEFRQKGVRVFGSPRHSAIVSSLAASFQKTARWMGVKVFPDDVSEFFMKVVRETVAFRENNNVHRDDFMDLLIALKKRDSDLFNLEVIAAQAFVFFLAGFETSSTTMMFALYELAMNVDIQQKLRNEIEAVLSKHNGQLTYEAIMDMKYLEQVINESLRKYPPVGTLFRIATKPYSIPNTNIVLPTGSQMLIPVYAIHHDPDIYPSPEIFDPERFSPDAIAARDRIAFLAFGDGPRNCIGARFGRMQSCVGMVALLRRYEFTRGDKTPVPIVFSENFSILTPVDGMWLNVRKL